MKLLVLIVILGFAQICLGSKTFKDVCDAFKTTPNVNGTVVDDLCNLFTQAKTLNVKNDTEWKVVYATLMTVALKDDLPKTNRTIYDVRQSFHDGMQKAAVAEPTIQSQTLNSISSETAFLKELESMLSTELDASDTEEALDFAKEVYQKTNSNKDIYYAMLIFHNTLGLSEETICNIMARNPNDCNELESSK